MSRITLADLPKPPPPWYRIYSPAGVTWATVIGGMAAGGVVLGINYWRWGQKREAWGAAVLGILALASLIGIAQVLPSRIPSAAYLVPQWYLAFQLTKSLQGKRFAEHLTAGGRKASNWKGVGIGAIFLILIGGGLLAWVLSSGNTWTAVMETQHSVSLGKGQDVFYSQGATQETARLLGNALKERGYLTPGQPASVILTGTGADKEVGFVVGAGAWDDPATIEIFQKLAGDIAPSIGGKPLTLRILDENLVEKKRFRIE